MRVRSALLSFCILLFFTSRFSSSAQTSSSPYDSVDPIIGTDGGGNTFPGATLPFGMIQWSPDTNTDACGMLLASTPRCPASAASCSARPCSIKRPCASQVVQSASIDSAPYANSWLPIGNLHPGTATLHFTMGTAPNKRRGSAIQDRPPSFQ